MSEHELIESHFQFREAWSAIARCSTNGQAIELPGLCIVDSVQPWVFANAAFLTQPVVDAADLARRASAVNEHFQGSGNQWFLSASVEWLGPDAEWVLAELGLVHVLNLTGMVADKLLASVRPLPNAHLRAITDEATRTAIADLNAAAYGVPSEWGRMAIGHERFWQGQLFGHIAYIDDIPVACNVVKPIDTALYVGWVVTAPAYRRQGLAELVIRRSLEEAGRATGLTRTILHATDEGRPVYQRMGYRPVATFPIWEPSST